MAQDLRLNLIQSYTLFSCMLNVSFPDEAINKMKPVSLALRVLVMDAVWKAALLHVVMPRYAAHYCSCFAVFFVFLFAPLLLVGFPT